jgi:hypothetical protein
VGLQARGSEAAKRRATGERTQDDAGSQRPAPILEPVSQLEHPKAHRKKLPALQMITGWDATKSFRQA